jgi:hypothetical protein
MFWRMWDAGWGLLRRIATDGMVSVKGTKNRFQGPFKKRPDRGMSGSLSLRAEKFVATE